jgi:hypothetical protein
MAPINARANGPQATPSKLRFEFNRTKQSFLFTSKPQNTHPKCSNTEENPALQLLENPKLYRMDPDDPPMPRPLSPPLSCTSGTVQNSLQVLSNEVHASHLSRQSDYVKGKCTDKTYKNRVKAYLEWWETDQAVQCENALKNGASWVTVPAHPITATKVALYLDYVVKRPQVNLIFCFSLYYSQPHILVTFILEEFRGKRYSKHSGGPFDDQANCICP